MQKQLLTALVLGGIMLGGSIVKAENVSDNKAVVSKEVKQLTEVEKVERRNNAMNLYCEKIMAKIKKIDEAKYNEIAALPDTKAKIAACNDFIVNKKLQEVKNEDVAKYNELESLKNSDSKAFKASLKEYYVNKRKNAELLKEKNKDEKNKTK